MQDAPHTSPFDAIRRIDEQGNEYWSARELAKVLGYNDYRNFQSVLLKAQEACQQSKQAVSDHFGDATDMIVAGKGAQRPRSDIHLTRYACYLIVQNADLTFATAMVPSRTPSMLCGPYQVQAVESQVVGVFTNKVTTAPHRGAGRPEAAYILERTMDRIAHELALDPAEVRRRNFIPAQAFPLPGRYPTLSPI